MNENQPYEARVLIVDDEEPVLRALQRCLRGEDCHLILASSGREALELLEEQPVDLVMSDLRMPGMNGLEFLQEVQQRWPETVRIILTAYWDVATALEALEEEAVYRFMSKPWSDEDLRLTVRQALEYHQVLKGNDSFRRRLQVG